MMTCLTEFLDLLIPKFRSVISSGIVTWHKVNDANRFLCVPSRSPLQVPLPVH